MNAVQQANRERRLENERRFVMKTRAGSNDNILPTAKNIQVQNNVTSIRTDDSTIAEINGLHNGIQNGLNAVVRNAIRIGELLTLKKSNLKHGEFLPWIEENCLFKKSMAQNYMNLYGKSLEIPEIAQAPSFREAFKMLSETREEKEINQPSTKQPSLIFAEFKNGKEIPKKDKEILVNWLISKETVLRNQQKQIKIYLGELKK